MQTQWTSWVKDNLVAGSTILELGSGDSTYGLIKEGHIVYSIEEDESFLGKHAISLIGSWITPKGINRPTEPQGITREIYNSVWANRIIHSPLQIINDYKWYNPEDIKNFVKDIKYDVLLIDGPACHKWDGPCREGMMENLDLFDVSVPWIFDDINRSRDRKLWEDCSLRLNKPKIHESDAFGVLGKQQL